MGTSAMSRNIEFDIMKGIGILLVMIGHTHFVYTSLNLPDWATLMINSFHVPLFFFIAGYFSKTYNGEWRETIAKYAKRLLIPYFVSALIILCYVGLLAYKRSTPELFYESLGSYLFAEHTGYFSRYFNFPFMFGTGPIWFLLALFWTKTLFYFISRAGKYTVPICIAISWFFSVFQIPLPFMLNQSLTALGFVAVGYWCRQIDITEIRKNAAYWVLIVGSVVCWVCCMIFNQSVCPYAAQYPIYPLNLVSALGATVLVYLISRVIAKTFVLSRVMDAIGRNSMNVLCAHTIDLRCNALRIVIKHVLGGVAPVICLIIDYIVVLILSFIPQIEFKKLLTKRK